MVDSDSDRFTVAVLRDWKQRAENAAAIALTAGSVYRPIVANELRQQLSVGELAAVRALEEEFGCHVETEVHIPAGDGWVRLDAAVVRGEDLVAIAIYEDHGHGIAYFQVEYLLELCSSIKFDRFQECVLYVVVVSDGPVEADAIIKSRLSALLEKSTVETHLRSYRLNSLRAQYSL